MTKEQNDSRERLKALHIRMQRFLEQGQGCTLGYGDAKRISDYIDAMEGPPNSKTWFYHEESDIEFCVYGDRVEILRGVRTKREKDIDTIELKISALQAFVNHIKEQHI